MKALLIDDQAFILAAFQSELLAFDRRVALVSVESARGARQAMATVEPFDFVLLDLQLACANGFDLLAELSHSHPGTPIVAVSGLVANADVVRAIYLGAVAFVPRHAGGQTLLLALRTVASGHIYVPPMIFGAGSCPVPAIGRVDQAVEDPRCDVHAASVRDSASFSSFGLTPRQTDVLTLLLQGQSNKLIARALNLSVETIKDHVTAVLRALNVKSRTQVVLVVSGGAQAGKTWREANTMPPSGSAQSRRAAALGQAIN
jgi:DNA-binding NarL/FixJ family response regulator